MAHLIPLHRPSGRAVWVNPDHIALLEADGDSAQLRLTTGHVAGIRETPDEILALLGLPGEQPERCSGCNALASEAPEYECLVPNCPMIAEALERR